MIYQASLENIQKGAEIIKRGGLVAFPTETVYGLGGDALNAEAVAKIFEAKNRPNFDPLIVHIADKDFLKELTIIDNETILKVIDKFWPGPLTIILKKRDCVPYIVTSGLETVAVRLPNNPIALELIRRAGGAVAGPSANPFGYLSPTSAEHVEEQLGNRIDMVLDGGECAVGVESTVIDMTSDVPVVLRPGGLEIEKLEEFFGEIKVYNRKVASITAPGQMESHYAPKTTLKIVKTIDDVNNKDCEDIGILLFKKREIEHKYRAVEILSQDGDMLEASSRLFHCLHNLDKTGVKTIYAESIPEIGLGRAIMDRLYKASTK